MQLAALMRAGKDLDESLGCSPLIYGNDVDSVDIATRVALVRKMFGEFYGTILQLQ